MLGIANALSVGMGGGGAPAFDPAAYGTVAWWLRGDDVTLNGSDIASWNDKSGNAKHYAQGTPAIQPAFVASAINGQPGVDFAASAGEYLSGPNLSLDGFTALETFIVMQLNADPPAAGGGGLWLVGVGSGGGDAIPFTTGKIYDGFGSSARKTTVNPTPSMAAPCVYNVVSTSGEWTNFLNGTQLYTTATNTVGCRNAASQLGASLSLAGYMDGVICEWLTFAQKLGATEKVAVKAYLSGRYGITLA